MTSCISSEVPSVIDSFARTRIKINWVEGRVDLDLKDLSCPVCRGYDCLSVFEDEAPPLALVSSPRPFSPSHPRHETGCARSLLRDPHGVLGDGPGNYTPNSVCEWFISPRNASLRFISLEFTGKKRGHDMSMTQQQEHRSPKDSEKRKRDSIDSIGYKGKGQVKYYNHLLFSEFRTECAYDYLFVLDGKGGLLASLSGSRPGARFLSSSGSMHLILYSDTNYALSGFSAVYNAFPCPRNCSERGTCSPTEGICTCQEGYSGEDCSFLSCPGGCKPGGQCSLKEEKCICLPGFTGYDCSLHESNILGNTWHPLNPPMDSIFTPRTSHSSVNLNGTIYFYGGYNLRGVLGDLILYDFRLWRTLSPSSGSPWPPPLYGHASVELDTNRFLLLGGKNEKHALWRMCGTSTPPLVSGLKSHLCPRHYPLM
ncbi:Uncharacterized protein FKW44_012623, partial [Caligus rogercresseyi]